MVENIGNRRAGTPTNRERAVLAREIQELEAKISSRYMEDDEISMEDDEISMEDDEISMEDDEISMEDDDLLNSVSLRANRRASSEIASEVDPTGVEEQITQDYLDEVVSLRDEEGLADKESMLDAAGGRKAAKVAYLNRLRKASSRLDRVAKYLEEHGKKAIAFRVDKIADAIDERIAKEEGSDE